MAGWSRTSGSEITPETIRRRRRWWRATCNCLQEAKAEIDTYGPNPGLIGSDIPAESGRAIQLLQAAGIAELGSFMTAYRGWKLRVYRKTWNAIQEIWQAPRWIRVTDDENLAQFIQVNGWQLDPETGKPQVLNQLAALDVDIIIDEGPDSVSTMADTFDTVLALSKGGAQVPPEMIIELSPLPSITKQRIMQQIAAAQQPKPMDQMAMQLQMQLLQAQIQQLQSQAGLNQAKGQQALAEAQTAGVEAQATLMEAQRGPAQQVDTAADLAKARLDQAKAARDRSQDPGRRACPCGREPPPPPPAGLFEVNHGQGARA